MSDSTPQPPKNGPFGERSRFKKFMKVMGYLLVGAIVLTVLVFGTCLLMLSR